MKGRGKDDVKEGRKGGGHRKTGGGARASAAEAKTLRLGIIGVSSTINIVTMPESGRLIDLLISAPSGPTRQPVRTEHKGKADKDERPHRCHRKRTSSIHRGRGIKGDQGSRGTGSIRIRPALARKSPPNFINRPPQIDLINQDYDLGFGFMDVLRRTLLSVSRILRISGLCSTRECASFQRPTFQSPEFRKSHAPPLTNRLALSTTHMHIRL